MWFHIYIYIHTHTHTHAMEIAIKKNKIMPFAAAWTELEMIPLSEVKSEKDKYDMISLRCGLKKNELCIYKTETHRHRKQTYGYQKERAEG